MRLGRVFIVVLTLLAGGMAQADDLIEPRLALPLFLKIITYDENFEPSEVDAVAIHLLYDKSNGSSYEMMIKTKEFFLANAGLTVKKVPVKFHAVEFSQSDSVWITIDEDDYNMMIVAGIDDDAIGRIMAEIKGKNIRSFSFDPALISAGVAVGIKMRKAKKAIFVNLSAARDEGSKFSAHLLKMCQIYEEAR